MENEPALIRQEMQQTRTALTEKLEALENQVMGTVHSATSAIQETVHSVRDAVEETTSTVRAAVQGTVGDVRTSLDETVGTVKETLDMELQVRRHPWLLVGGAACAGFLSGKMIDRMTPSQPAYYAPSPRTPVTEGDWPTAPVRSAAVGESALRDRVPHEPQTWASSVLTSLEPEAQKLKGLAIGALFNVVKGMVRQWVPHAVEPQVVDMVDSVTRKMGGRPLEGSIMEEYEAAFR
jgi:ElaB/YqjD/DUF883 family membrane-anchored ribosome-binding protein